MAYRIIEFHIEVPTFEDEDRYDLDGTIKHLVDSMPVDVAWSVNVNEGGEHIVAFENTP